MAIRLAQELGGEIINADSMQVYRDLRTLTARPSDEDLARAPHHLFGHVDGAVRYNTGAWLKDAVGRIAQIQARGHVPILAGGTGMYFAALVNGLSSIPDISDENREKARKLVWDDRDRAIELLGQVDPEAAARIKRADSQRLGRALEVYFQTGKSLSAFQTPNAPSLSPGEWLGISLTPRRETLYARIDARFENMMKTGADEEVRDLFERRLPDDLPLMRAHGVPALCSHYRDEISREEAIAIAQRDTRRYAKRQFTWIANQFPTWPRVPSEDIKTREEVIFALYAELEAVLLKNSDDA